MSAQDDFIIENIEEQEPYLIEVEVGEPIEIGMIEYDKKLLETIKYLLTESDISFEDVYHPAGALDILEPINVDEEGLGTYAYQYDFIVEVSRGTEYYGTAYGTIIITKWITDTTGEGIIEDMTIELKPK